MYAGVVTTINHKEVDKIFHYKIPSAWEGKIIPGCRVLVPFGGGNSRREGFVVSLDETAELEPEKIKEIIAPLDDFPVFTPVTLQLALWMKEKYYATLVQCLQCVMPTGIGMKNDFVVLAVPGEGKALKGRKKLVLDYIRLYGKIPQRELIEVFGRPCEAVLKELEKAGLVELRHIYQVSEYSIRMKQAAIQYENENIDGLLKSIGEKGGKQAQVIQLLSGGSLAVSDIKGRLGISDSPIKTLEKAGAIKIETVEIRRNPVKPPDEAAKRFVLTGEQREAVEKLANAFHKGGKMPFLIHGVTGSGKTEIYIRLIEEAVKSGKQAIMLVPEISLTPQAVEVFTSRFGYRVTVTHSRLSIGERYDQWKRARDGQVDIIIGPRSAIFTPFPQLGVIIIDEEHENTYKSETTPKYHVKEVAGELSRLTGCLVILGSATPSVATYYEAETEKLNLVTLKERVNRRLPEVEIVDMRFELAQGNRSIFSKALFEAIGKNLESKNQTILFMNRRGHSTFVSCRSCGYVMECQNCNVNFTYHIYSDRLICHYCGREEKNPPFCPQCGSKHIKYFGAGTQKIEEEVKKHFPQARVLRMDMDTTGRKNSHEKIINLFARGEADILVGTQMIAKGLNFPNVSLVGIVAADIALNAGDFRSAENAYQLITQVSGRAGRAEIAGKVFIQTYNPEHYSIVCACENNYQEFYRQEITVRRQMLYPPFSYIFQIVFTGRDEKKIIACFHRLVDVMAHYNRKGLYETLGPAPAVISKIRGNYRWKLLVKALDEEKLKAFVTYCVDTLWKREDMSGINANLTLNPIMIV